MSLPIHRRLWLALWIVWALPGCGPTIDGDRTAQDPAAGGAEGDGSGGDGSATGGASSGGEGGETDADEDGDGHPASVDCDDTDPAVHPGAIDVCFDARDNDCDGLRTCVDLVVWVEADGSDAGSGVWALAERLESARPTRGGDATVEASLACVSGAPQTFGCSPGSMHTFTLESVGGQLVWDEGVMVRESGWSGTLYRADAEGAFDYAGGRFGYRQRVEFDGEQMDAGGGGPG